MWRDAKIIIRQGGLIIDCDYFSSIYLSTPLVYLSHQLLLQRLAFSSQYRIVRNVSDSSAQICSQSPKPSYINFS